MGPCFSSLLKCQLKHISNCPELGTPRPSLDAHSVLHQIPSGSQSCSVAHLLPSTLSSVPLKPFTQESQSLTKHHDRARTTSERHRAMASNSTVRERDDRRERGREVGERGRRRGEWGGRGGKQERKGESGRRAGRERRRTTEWFRHSITHYHPRRKQGCFQCYVKN